MNPIPIPMADPFWTRWGRRIFCITCATVLWAFFVVFLPILILLAGIVDLWQKDLRYAKVRCVLFFVWFLTQEIVSLVSSLGLWLGNLFLFFNPNPVRYAKWNFDLQQWWLILLFRIARRIFGLTLEVQNLDVAKESPFILLIRHTSIGDTVLPALLVSRPNQILLRYVLKRELLWNPIFDIVGQRIPNYFVRRGGDTKEELLGIQQLMKDLGPKDGVLIYPEGTRFTAKKREKILAKLADSSLPPEILEKARGFKNVLPPKIAGALAIFEKNEGVDVIFCAHTGLEGVTSFRELLNGNLIGRMIRVKFWRIPFADIPKDHDRQIEWLYEQWTYLDQVVDSLK